LPSEQVKRTLFAPVTGVPEGAESGGGACQKLSVIVAVSFVMMMSASQLKPE
jgi:hypothetical protein